MKETQLQEPVKLDYVSSQPAPPPRRNWLIRLLLRMSKPMPMGMYYVITFVLSLIAFVIVVVIKLVMAALK